MCIRDSECAKGAKEAGNNVKVISLKGKDIKYCIGCLSCQNTGRCVISDDVPLIMEKVKNAEVIVFATPIYYYEMCGQMKTLLDRLNPLYGTDYKFRDIYMIATAAEDEEHTMDTTLACMRGMADCIPGSKEMGVIYGKGVYGKGEVNFTPAYEEAYEMGKRV